MYHIEWLAIGTITVPSGITFHLRQNGSVPTVAYAFLLTDHNGRHHLIDTGVRSPEEINVGRPPDRHWVVHPEDTLLTQLSQRGIQPADIETVCLTHLHYDHCSQVGLFPQAKIVVSRAEWLSVIAPAHRGMLAHTRYPRDVYAQLVDAAWERLSLADDNSEILPGIQILVLGGHTPGSAAYYVETPSGPHVVAGDFINTYENYQGPGHPPGILVSLQEWYQGWERLKALNAVVIPSHDPGLKIRYPDGKIA